MCGYVPFTLDILYYRYEYDMSVYITAKRPLSHYISSATEKKILQY